MKINLISAANPVWANAEQSKIILDCEFDHYPGELMQFCATPDDSEIHGRLIFAAAADGTYGEVAPYVAPVRSATARLQVEIEKRGITPEKIALALLENDAAKLTALRADVAAAKAEAAK